MQKPLRIGVIGLTEGNGHPFSWSAILNGYDKIEMETCGFPRIPKYLGLESWPAARLREARVTSVWTQDRSLSEKISRTCRVPRVCDSLEEMAETVDGVLLARDDHESHFSIARIFLDKNIPVYIDKPIATSLKALSNLYALQKWEGQIFTCSATRYSNDLDLGSRLSSLPKEAVREIHGTAPKSWAKYAVHVIEPIVAFVGLSNLPKEITTIPEKRTSSGNGNSLFIGWEGGLLTSFHTTGQANSDISIRVVTDNDVVVLTFTDTFFSFRSALKDFIGGIQDKKPRSSKIFNERVVSIIEAGLN